MTDAPRILAYCAAIYGLGHERPTLAVLSEIRTRLPDAQMLLVSGTQPHLTGLRPPGLDVLVLPDAKHHGKPGGLRSSLLSAAIAAYEPDLIYVDEEPAGHQGELRPALETLSNLPKRPHLVVGMRDILNAPRYAVGYARSLGHDVAQERYYDQTIVFGDPTLFDPVTEYGWSATVAAKTSVVGYMQMATSPLPPESVRDELGFGNTPFVLVTTGGGADGRQLLECAIDALADKRLAHIRALVVTGPLGSRHIPALRNRAGSGKRVRIEPFRDDLASDMNAADLVVSMAGVNTMSEIAALEKRAVVVPRKHAEQELRADLFAARGLVRTFRWADLTAERLADEMAASLQGPSPHNTLDFGGLPRAGQLIADLFEPQFTPFPE